MISLKLTIKVVAFFLGHAVYGMGMGITLSEVFF